MRGHLHARRTLKGLAADLRVYMFWFTTYKRDFHENLAWHGKKKATRLRVFQNADDGALNLPNNTMTCTQCAHVEM